MMSTPYLWSEGADGGWWEGEAIGGTCPMHICSENVKTFKNLRLQNQKSYDLETWHVALGTQTLQSLYK